jgi:2-oxoacid dehydrogenases acyltransferase (catalytic domain)
MAGGTYTISNGGVFGSMMGTPIINLPQTAVLGLHAIKERPMAINGKVEIRPVCTLLPPWTLPMTDYCIDDVPRSNIRPPHPRRQRSCHILGENQGMYQIHFSD